MSLKNKNVVVTGGSRGLGLGLVEALVAHGARVTVVARESDALESVHSRLGVAIIPADVTDDVAAKRILAEVRPDIVVLNAGATPRMARFGAPFPPRQFGDHLVAVLEDPRYATGIAFGLKGDTGITVLEGEAA